MSATFQNLCRMEVEEMNRHKWIESEKAGYDLGDAACIDWVDRFFDEFARAHVDLFDQVRKDALLRRSGPDLN